MTNEKNKNSAGEIIWETIKNRPISLYSLPNQKVSDHVRKQKVAGDILLVTLASGSVLPALEQAVCDKYTVEVTERNYVIVREKPAEVDTKQDEENSLKERAQAAVNLKSIPNI